MTSLQRGSSLTREINPKESHFFELTCEADQIVTLMVSAEDMNFAARLVTPDGSTLAEITHRRFGPVTWQFVAPIPGRYQIVLSSLEAKEQPHKYQLKVEQFRSATQQEKRAARAAADFYRAEVLRFKWQSDELAQASKLYEAAGLAWQQLGQWTEAAEAWQRLGELHLIQGSYEEALHAYNEALRFSHKSDDPFPALVQLNNVAYVYIYLGNIEQALSRCEQVKKQLNQISVGQTSLRRRIEAQLENNFGEIEYARGHLKISLNFFARALALWEAVGDRQGIARAHLNIGHSYLDSGNVNEATASFEQALQLWREIADWRGEALTLTAQGNLYALLGDKHTALAAHREAQSIFRSIGDRQGEAVTSNGLGDVFEDLGLKQEAVDNYSLALQLNHAIGNKAFEAVSSYYLGRVYRDSGDFTRALNYYGTSLALSRQSGKARMATHALMDIAAIYVQQRKFPEALRLYSQSLAFYQQIGDLRRQALSHHGLGELYRTRGETEQAINEYQQGLDLFLRLRDPQGEAESRYWLAKLYQAQGRLSQALTESEKSIKLIETQRALVLGQNWRSAYFASVHRHFELYVDILMQLHKQQPERGFAALALQASERAKARSLLELLAETQGGIRRDVEPSLLKQEQQLRQQLSAKQNYLTQMLNAAAPEVEIAGIELEIRQLTYEYDFVQAQINRQSPVYAQLTQPSTLRLPEIQAMLKEDEGVVLLEYMLGDERSYLWLVTADTLIAEELPGRRVLENLSQEVSRVLTARQFQPHEDMAHYHERVALAEAQFCPRVTQLSQFILAPLKRVTGAQRLLVVADGGLQYIPFDALPLPGEAEKSGACQMGSEPPTYIPLLTTLEVINLPSFSSLALLRQLKISAPPRSQDIAIWADPVFESDDPRLSSALPADSQPARVSTEASGGADAPEKSNELILDGYNVSPSRLLGTQEEAERIMKFAPAGAVMLLSGFAANRENTLERDLQGYRILHFATHALTNNRHPALSGLLLSTVDAQGHQQNGLLQMHDIYGLRLNADLVVLSACQTGLGKELSGEGVVGLTQGFLYAGSSSVVVSLWKVEDKATATLMSQFYQAMLKDGAAPSVALRRAKLMMYGQSSRQSPYYWSAFIIQGEYRTPSSTGHGFLQPRSLWAWSALLAISLWLLHSWRRRRLS